MRSFSVGSEFEVNLKLLHAPTADYEMKLRLHNPAELPLLDNNYFMVKLDQGLTVSVKPTLTTTSDDLSSYDPIR